MIVEENLKSGYFDLYDNSFICCEINDGNDVCILEVLFLVLVVFFGVCFSLC